MLTIKFYLGMVIINKQKVEVGQWFERSVSGNIIIYFAFTEINYQMFNLVTLLWLFFSWNSFSALTRQNLQEKIDISGYPQIHLLHINLQIQSA